MALEKIPFGLADITIGDGETDALVFDGATAFQADGGELTLTPSFTDITIADFGDSTYDQRVLGYNGSLSIVAAEATIRNMQAALAASEEVTTTDGTTGEATVVGLTDSPIGTSIRSKARRVRVHPRGAANADDDIVIYMMASNGEISRGYGNAQGNLTITLAMFPRDGLSASDPGNFFYIGPQDPNAVA